MPYITKEQVAGIRANLKKTFPKVKFSVTRDNHSAVRVVVLESPYKWDKDNFGVNEFYPEKYDNAEFLKGVIAIMNEGNGVFCEDGDYGTVPKFYTDLSIGRWDRPHVRK